jgi:hypothetical protein
VVGRISRGDIDHALCPLGEIARAFGVLRHWWRVRCLMASLCITLSASAFASRMVAYDAGELSRSLAPSKMLHRKRRTS